MKTLFSNEPKRDKMEKAAWNRSMVAMDKAAGFHQLF